jgi:hypothetical protein
VGPQLAPPPSRQRRTSFSPAEANVSPLPALHPPKQRRSCVSAEHSPPSPRAAAPSTHAPPQLPASLSLHRVPLAPSPTAARPLPTASRQQRSKPRAPASSPTCSPRVSGLLAVAE